MMKKFFSILVLVLLASGISFAQSIQRPILVEHFTNTLCGVCASRNPGFIKNLENNPQVLHISFHPSRPYSACQLNKHNTLGNDNRTKYYDIFGSTPRLVVNGKPVATNQDYGKSEIFAAYTSLESDISANVISLKVGSDSVHLQVSIKNLNSINTKIQFAAFLVEDTVFYKAPNGETEHYNVFRQGFTAVEGTEITLPSKGDSVILTYSVASHNDWDLARLNSMVILQDVSTKELLYAQIAETTQLTLSIQKEKVETPKFEIYPNPASQIIQIKPKSNYLLYNNIGVLVQQLSAIENEFDVANLPNGIYFLVDPKNGAQQKFIKY